MFQSYVHIKLFFILICYFIKIPTIEAQANTSILAELETGIVGRLAQGSIINYVYDIRDNSFDIKRLFPFSNSTITSNENIFITITTCKAPLNLTKRPKTTPAKQLEVWISTKLKNPGPRFDGGGGGDKYTLKNGYLSVSIPNDNDGINVGVYAPKLSDNYYTDYYFEIGASVNGFKHQAPVEHGIILDDTDNNDALLRTFYTNASSLSYKIYFVESIYVSGISMSLCAYRDNGWDTNVTYNRIEKDGNFQYSIFISNLRNGTKYSALAMEESDDGFKPFMPIEFQTQSQSNCTLITNLSFCNKVSYAVPQTISKTTEAELKSGYDNLAKSYFDKFTSIVDQYPCNDTGSKYSLIRNCNDCKEAYKDWICAIAIPRCTNEGVGKERDKPHIEISDQSMQINQPFIELSPCIDLCYNVTKSCPTVFGFSCPDLNINSTYGGAGTCNYLDISPKSNVAVRI